MKIFNYAIKNGNLIYIDDVKNGLKCGCICPACQQILVAKNSKNNSRVHHFAHATRTDCRYARETSLHLLAKEILSESKVFLLPPLYTSEHMLKCIDNEKLITIQEVRVEKKDVGGVKPDIIIYDHDGNMFFVEIYVTHKVDNDKINRIKTEKINTIEIDLSKINRLLTKAELKQILETDIKLKKWIYNDKMEEYIFDKSEKLKSNFRHNNYSIEHNMERNNGEFRQCKKCGKRLKVDFVKRVGYYKCDGHPCCTYSEKATKACVRCSANMELNIVSSNYIFWKCCRCGNEEEYK